MSRRSVGFPAMALLMTLTGMAVGRDFVATDADFGCITAGHKVPGKNFYIAQSGPHRLQKALRLTRHALKTGRGGFHYPVGTILQLFPAEAMVKRRKGFNPAGGDWEYFKLAPSAQGTTILERGMAEVANGFGSCQGCHVRQAPSYDDVCEYVVGTSALNLTDALVATIQAADPRCHPAAP